MAAQRYAAVGKCIYCGAAAYSDALPDKRLSDEHIIPLALGGDLILPEASCERCARLTSTLEGDLARELFLPARVQLNFPTRHKKNRPTHLPLEVYEGNQSATKPIAIDDYPGMLLMFRFMPPGLLMNQAPTEEFAGQVVVSKLPGFDQNLGKHPRSQVKWNLKKVDASTYARMIAKIAHSYAVAKFGPETFQPFLPKLILGEPPMHLARFIGCDGIDNLSATPNLYEISAAEETWNSRRYVIVRARLFANREGSPTYMVVAGAN